jgi:hypothetical protein
MERSSVPLSFRNISVALLSAASSCALACDTSVDVSVLPDAARISPICRVADDHSDLAWIQENIFDRSCARFTACHMGDARQAAGLNLESGMAVAELLDVPSTVFPTLDLVEPGDPVNSYLMVITQWDGATDGPLGEAGTMPFNNDLLCDQKLDALARWITAMSP